MKTQKKKKELEVWISETKHMYNMFKNMPKEELDRIARFSGFDMNYYKTKSMMAKAITSKLSWSVLPICMGEWK